MGSMISKDAVEKIRKAFKGEVPVHEVRAMVEEVIEHLDHGRLRVCERTNGAWTNHEYIKEAILLYFRLTHSQVITSGAFSFFDKIPVKKWTGEEGVRVVPQAMVRRGAFVEKSAILMPSYVNIGAYVGEGTMVDTWATVGSCAQIGKMVHLSGGVGIGGVLEPVQARPVIIEDHVFVGSRCVVVEGVHIEEGAVLGAGVVLTASTKIIDVSESKEETHQMFVPKNSVVIPGSIDKEFPSGKYAVPCALIIGKRKESTDKKTSLTDALRDYGVAV